MVNMAANAAPFPSALEIPSASLVSKIRIDLEISELSTQYVVNLRLEYVTVL